MNLRKGYDLSGQLTDYGHVEDIQDLLIMLGDLWSFEIG